MKRILIATLVLLASPLTQAQFKKVPRQAVRPTLTYDLGVSTGSYNGTNYNEINLGLNWHLNSFTTWRNALYSRFGSQEAASQGLDSSLRFDYNYLADGGAFGFNLFGGPGYRFSKKDQSASFLEGGLKLKLAGLTVGGGVKILNYSDPGTNADGTARAKQDTTLFLILAGSGAF
jgi:hypothetical protein